SFDQLTRSAAHALHLFRVLEKINHFNAGVFGTFHLDGGPGFDEASGDGRKVFHGWAEDWDFSECRGFEDVVTAGIHERATDKNAVGEAVKRSEFTDGIEQEDGDIVGNAVLAGVCVGGNA